MGRQQRYERGVSVDKAMCLFWRNGYSGTSMRDLERVLDMRPGSIYATFGSKEELYLEALEKYASTTGECLTNAVKARGLMSGLRRFMTELLLGDGSEPASRACMVAKTLADLEPRNAKLKIRAVELMEGFGDKFSELLAEARALGEIPAGADISALSRFIQIQITGIRAFAETDLAEGVLLDHIEDVMEAIEHKANAC